MWRRYLQATYLTEDSCQKHVRNSKYSKAKKKKYFQLGNQQQT